jgi:hypothetical protein
MWSPFHRSKNVQKYLEIAGSVLAERSKQLRLPLYHSLPNSISINLFIAKERNKIESKIYVIITKE